MDKLSTTLIGSVILLVITFVFLKLVSDASLLVIGLTASFIGGWFMWMTYLKVTYLGTSEPNLNKIVNWLEVPKTKPNEPITPSFEVRKLILSLILEETSELAESFGRESLEEFSKQLEQLQNKILDKLMKEEFLKEGNNHVLDALVDLEFVLHNATFYTGNYNKYQTAFEAVLASNWTKFDRTLEDAEITKKAYQDKGIEVHINQKTVNGDLYYFCTNLSGKILKSHNYTEPIFHTKP